METRRRSFLENFVDNLGISEGEIYRSLNEKQKREVNLNVEKGFHKSQLSKIRKSIGTKLTYISHLQVKGEYFIKANLRISSGIKTYTFKLEVPPSQMNENDYKYVLEQLKKIG